MWHNSLWNNPFIMMIIYFLRSWINIWFVVSNVKTVGSRMGYQYGYKLLCNMSNTILVYNCQLYLYNSTSLWKNDKLVHGCWEWKWIIYLLVFPTKHSLLLPLRSPCINSASSEYTKTATRHRIQCLPITMPR